MHTTIPVRGLFVQLCIPIPSSSPVFTYVSSVCEVLHVYFRNTNFPLKSTSKFLKQTLKIQQDRKLISNNETFTSHHLVIRASNDVTTATYGEKFISHRTSQLRTKDENSSCSEPLVQRLYRTIGTAAVQNHW